MTPLVLFLIRIIFEFFLKIVFSSVLYWLLKASGLWSEWASDLWTFRCILESSYPHPTFVLTASQNLIPLVTWLGWRSWFSLSWNYLESGIAGFHLKSGSGSQVSMEKLPIVKIPTENSLGWNQVWGYHTVSQLNSFQPVFPPVLEQITCSSVEHQMKELACVKGPCCTKTIFHVWIPEFYWVHLILTLWEAQKNWDKLREQIYVFYFYSSWASTQHIERDGRWNFWHHLNRYFVLFFFFFWLSCFLWPTLFRYVIGFPQEKCY